MTTACFRAEGATESEGRNLGQGPGPGLWLSAPCLPRPPPQLNPRTARSSSLGWWQDLRNYWDC